jgi:threonine/homoserine/homoserine lactone efflux protein
VACRGVPGPSARSPARFEGESRATRPGRDRLAAPTARRVLSVQEWPVPAWTRWQLTGRALPLTLGRVELSLLAFLGIAALVIVTPGPDTALTIRNTLSGGRAGGLATALGVATGQAIWTVVTSAGLAALLVASTSAFAALRLVGAAYLAWLGFEALWTASRARDATGRETKRGPSCRLSATRAFRQGVLSNLGNPKMAVFFTSLLPPFAPTGRVAFPALLALGLLFCGMTVVWLAAYAAVVARAGDVLRRRLGVRRAIEAVTGLALLALGARLALDRR